MFAKPEQFSKNSLFQISVLLMTVTIIHKESKKPVLIYLSTPLYKTKLAQAKVLAKVFITVSQGSVICLAKKSTL